MANTVDMYNPNMQNTSIGDSLSDRFLGTNNTAIKNSLNSYELNKATQINKYGWNVQGMLDAGINPLAAAGSLGQGGTSPTSNMQQPNDLLSRVINKGLKALGDGFDMVYNPQTRFDNGLKIVSLLQK